MGLDIPARLPGWRKALTAYLAQVDGVKFRPGKHDCALFCAGAVKAMTGFDGARGWRGYRTLNEGQKRLASDGFAEWWDMLADRETKEVRIGDVAVVKHDDALAGGICLGSQIAVVTPAGRGLVPYGQIIRGYRI